MRIIIFMLLFPCLLFAQEQEFKPGDHELFFMPTAYTMEKGQSYFSDYELFFLNYTFAPAARTHIGIFTLFPITSDFLETLTFGVKQNYMQRENVALAAWATYTPKGSGLTVGNVFSFGKKKFSGHVGISGITGLDDNSNDWELVYMLGMRYDTSERLSFLAEYTNLKSGFENNFGGLITFGFRFRSSTIAWELGGVRPLEETGDFLFFPILKATFQIK